ncbi:nickel/cobalt transporter [Oricola cellulosilytica]|uniref:nickel/cobalt transporter n=1 Tax=Oricola cellulosilytica TaxID=1429082 RepID=UPI0018EE8793|nr:nickel/cobalt transporter [Oricola cellulosilytica]
MTRAKSARLGAVIAILLLGVAAAQAQSSLGIGSNEVSVQPSGVFAGLFAWINEMQRGFYRAMTNALKAMREDGGAAWLLVGLSFAYGIFHAAGPGHGKAVISSYMLANEILLRRGVVLSFISAFLQAISAIVLVGAAYLVLRGTAVSMTDATWFMEVASYALIALFGAWLLLTKLRVPSKAGALSPVAAMADSADHHHHHGEGGSCDTCGHAHAPDPKHLAGPLHWRSAWTAVAAVGLRPCSGALIVLTFALLNGLYAGGVLSVFAMALGTAITVSALATLAVTAKNVALKVSGSGAMSARVHRTVEIGGAALVLLLGLLLLGGALA